MDGKGKSWLQIPMRVNTVVVNSKESSMHKRLELRNTRGRSLYTCIIFQIRSVILQSSAWQWFWIKLCPGYYLKLLRLYGNVAGIYHPIKPNIRPVYHCIESQLGTLRKGAVGAWHVACGWVIYVCDIHLHLNYIQVLNMTTQDLKRVTVSFILYQLSSMTLRV